MTGGGFGLISTAAVLMALAGCGGPSDSTTKASSTPSRVTAAADESIPQVPTAAILTSCVNTLLSQAGAPPEHGGERAPAFVMQRGRGHATAALSKLAERAGGGVLAVNTDQVDPESSPVELYFFGSAPAATGAFPVAKREVAETNADSAGGTSGVTANVIYLERGPVAPRLERAISSCLKQHGGKAIS